MAIETLSVANAAHLYGVNSKRTRHQETKKSAFAPREERVEISTEAKNEDRVFQAVEESPDVRIELVAELQAKIKSNDYPIENNLDEAIRKMIQNDIFSSVA